jgi:hypothetical protein
MTMKKRMMSCPGVLESLSVCPTGYRKAISIGFDQLKEMIKAIKELA